MNEVEETLRVLNNQIVIYQTKAKMMEETQNEFIQKCKSILDEKHVTIITNMLKNTQDHYLELAEKTIEARQEILEKYHIQNKEE